MKRKAVQKFNPEYLQATKDATPLQIVEFLENYRLMQAATEVESILISLRVPSDLLRAFRAKCEIAGEKYQTQIKNLMKQFVEE
jgi:predicted DNA binding CopG/RHH family protein